MYLERRDPVSGRWLLYASRQHHHTDCKRYPFDQIPGRVFLDTSVINLIVKNGAAIFDAEEIDPETPLNQGREIEALIHLFAVEARAQWSILASSTSMIEVSRTPCEKMRSELQSYVCELIERLPVELDGEDTTSRGIVSTDVLGALPGQQDRELVSHAVALGCEAFVSTDMRTIISKRHRLPPLPLRILTPCEWWAHVKPWGQLWI